MEILMIVYGNIRKSKTKKSTKAVREQHDQWLANLMAQKTSFSRGKVKVTKVISTTPSPYRRETQNIPSLNTGFVNCTKPIQGNVYTGNKIVGIGTLHKSNAVPVFSSEDAVEISRMRRG
jgi:hypothetical protein